MPMCTRTRAPRTTSTRTAGGRAFGVLCIGIAHGAGGSGGVGILLVASIQSQPVAVAALVLLAAGTAAAMTALSGGLGLALFRWRSSFLPAPSERQPRLRGLVFPGRA